MYDEERAAWERALNISPDDAVLRRLYAQWLEERFADDEAGWHRRQVAGSAARAWLADFAERVTEGEPVTVEAVVRAGHRWLDTGESSCLSGLGFAAENLMLVEREDFWRHWQAYTGRTVPKERQSDEVFRCSC